MFILPYSTELRLARKPWVTFAIMLLCTVIFIAEQDNRSEIFHAAYNYCDGISNENLPDDHVNYMAVSLLDCIRDLSNIHEAKDPGEYRALLKQFSRGVNRLGEDVQEQAIDRAWQHYEEFSLDIPRSLDARLNHDPRTFNPLDMLTSAFSHGDWFHLVGNLIFFFAFAPAIELLVGSALRFLGVFVTIEILTGIVYTLVCYATGDFRPTLGLSGFVMGVIGLSAYLMPRARIRTLFWFIVTGRTFYIPAIALAAWYIGLDTYYLLAYSNSGGVNLVAHVTGGIAGYLLGMLWFRARREETREALDEEITYMRENRKSLFLGNSATTEKGDRAKIDNEYLLHEHRRDHARRMDAFYNMVKTGQNSRAIAQYCDEYEEDEGMLEYYVMLFNEMEHWKKGRSWLCLGRLLIDLYLARNLPAKALDIARRCIEETEYFVIGDPGHVLFLARLANDMGDADLALGLLFKAGARYGKDIDVVQCVIEEARLLWLQRGDARQALAKLTAVKSIASEHELALVNELVGQLEAAGVRNNQ